MCAYVEALCQPTADSLFGDGVFDTLAFKAMGMHKTVPPSSSRVDGQSRLVLLDVTTCVSKSERKLFCVRLVGVVQH
jgi:hypothetical protein